MSSAATPGAGRSRAVCLRRAALGLALFAGYLAASFGLSGDANILRLNSSIFDLDVGRIVHDWATSEPGRRTHAHPLYKLLMAPLGTGIQLAGLRPVDATRVLAAASMALNALLVGALASQLAGGARGARTLATLLCAGSFSSLLLAGIPDAASVSCLATVAPLLFLNARAARRFGWGEAAGWSLLGAFALAVTVTQIAHWAIALLARVSWLRPAAGRSDGGAPLAARLLAIAVGGALLVCGAVELQERVYPGTGRFWERKAPLAELRSFRHPDRSDTGAGAHALRLARHFGGVNFVAPMPAYSDYVIREWRQPYWSLSLEEARDWQPAQRALQLAWLGTLALALLSLRRCDRRFAAPLLCVASQFALHFAYGREYILYSPNWHGAVTAVCVAALWNAWPDRWRALSLAVGTLCLGIALNSLAVMDRVYREVAIGLEASRRDDEGRPLAPAPGRSAAAGAGGVTSYTR